TANPVYQQVSLLSNAGRVAGSGNYAVFSGLSADSLLIRTEEFNSRCGVNAVQIVPRATPTGPVVAPLPASQVYAGGTAILRAGSGGLLPFTYQWYKNGVALSDSGNVSGSATANLTIVNATGGNAGNYSVTVANTNGTTTSTTNTLTVVSPAAGSYAEKIFTNHPVAYWRLNEAGDPSTNFSPAFDPAGGFNGIYGTLAQNGFDAVTGPQPP